jgi:hypothetical protein
VCCDCTALVYDGGSRCSVHARPAWDGPKTESSRVTGTREFTKLRRQTFERDGGMCRAQLEGCARVAVECHHLDQVADFGKTKDIGRLLSVCRPCHIKLTAAAKNNPSSGAPPPAPRPVRKRRRARADVPAVPRTIVVKAWTDPS